MITDPLVLATLIGLALLAVSGVALQLVIAYGWNAPLDAALAHLAGYATGCVSSVALAFQGAPGGLCWLAACVGYIAWMAGGYALWTLRTVRG